MRKLQMNMVVLVFSQSESVLWVENSFDIPDGGPIEVPILWTKEISSYNSIIEILSPSSSSSPSVHFRILKLLMITALSKSLLHRILRNSLSRTSSLSFDIQKYFSFTSFIAEPLGLIIQISQKNRYFDLAYTGEESPSIETLKTFRSS